MITDKQILAGIRIKSRIVEACRTEQTCKSLAPLVFCSPSNTFKYCRKLEEEGWLRVSGTNGRAKTFLTIQKEPYPDTVETYKIYAEKPIPQGARTIRMEDLQKIDGYYDRPLKRYTGYGIPSSLGDL